MTGNPNNRFSDDELNHFYEDYKLHKNEEVQLSNRLLECQDELRLAIDKLSENVESNQQSLNRLSTETKDLVSTWHDAQGAVKVMAWIGGVIKWIGGITIVYFGIIEAIKHIDKVK